VGKPELVQNHNEIYDLRLIAVELTQFSHLGSGSSEVDPQAIVGITVQTLEAVFAVTICYVRDYPHRYAALRLNHRAAECSCRRSVMVPDRLLVSICPIASGTRESVKSEGPKRADNASPFVDSSLQLVTLDC
jgi:hypothetical protein